MERFELEPDVPETGLQYAGRQAARSTARLGEVALGAPSDIAAGGGNILDYFIKKGPVFGESAGQSFGFGAAASKYLPTSENIKKHVTGRIAEHLPEKYLEPQNAGEEFSDEVFDTLSSLASPLLGSAKVGLKAATALAGSGTLAKFAARELGASEGVQSGVKVGTMLLGSFLGHKSLSTAKKDLYTASETAAEALSPKTTVKANKILPALDKIEGVIASGAKGAPEKKALKFIRDVEDQINYVGRDIPLNSLTRLKKQLNDMIYNSTDVAETKAATRLLRPLKTSFLETFESNRGKYPEVINNLLAADEIHAATSRIAGIKEFVKDNLKGKFKSNFTSLLFGNLFGPLKGISKAKAAIDVVGGLYQTGKGALQIGSTLLQSPQIRKHYTETMNSALRQNASSFIRNARLLDNAVYEEEEKMGDRRYELVD